MTDQAAAQTATQTATLYRMVLPDHACPFGIRAKAMLEQAGYAVDDKQLNSREAVDAFKAEQDVETTPVTFIGEQRFATSEALEDYLGASVGT